LQRAAEASSARERHCSTSRGDTNGEAVVIGTSVAPDGFVPAAHLHPFQLERFEILTGTAEVRVGSER
jgi:hypothetical protein